MKGCAFHAFNIWLVEPLQPLDHGSGAAYSVDCNAGSALQLIQDRPGWQILQRIHQVMMRKRRTVVLPQADAEQVAELAVVVCTQVAEYFAGNQHRIADRPATLKTSSYTGLYGHFRKTTGKVFAQLVGRGGHTDAGQQHFHFQASHRKTARLWLFGMFSEPVQQRLYFRQGGCRYEYFHTVKVRCTLIELLYFCRIMIYLTRVEHFNAAHKLFNPEWSREQNLEVFGKCANDNWHGHNYELHVTVKGMPDPETGFVFNAKTLGELIKDVVIEKVDHRNLNLDVDFMKDKFTSAENVAIAIWEQLEQHLPQSVQLHYIRLHETPKIYVEYYGGK